MHFDMLRHEGVNAFFQMRRCIRPTMDGHNLHTLFHLRLHIRAGNLIVLNSRNQCFGYVVQVGTVHGTHFPIPHPSEPHNRQICSTCHGQRHDSSKSGCRTMFEAQTRNCTPSLVRKKAFVYDTDWIPFVRVCACWPRITISFSFLARDQPPPQLSPICCHHRLRQGINPTGINWRVPPHPLVLLLPQLPEPCT